MYINRYSNIADILQVVAVGTAESTAEPTILPTTLPTIFPTIIPTIKPLNPYIFHNKTEKQQRRDLISKAGSQIKYKEGRNNNNKYCKYFLDKQRFKDKYINKVKNYRPWCSTFVAWCARNATINEKLVPTYFNVKKYIYFYKRMNRYVTNNRYKPKAGDLIFFKHSYGYHIGFVRAYKNGRVYTIEGNATSVTSLVGGVVKKIYSLDMIGICGYGINYSKVKTS